MRLTEASLQSRVDLRRHNEFLNKALPFPLVLASANLSGGPVEQPEVEAERRVHRLRLTYHQLEVVTKLKEVRAIEVFSDHDMEVIIKGQRLEIGKTASLSERELCLGVSLAYVYEEEDKGNFRLKFVGHEPDIAEVKIIPGSLLISFRRFFGFPGDQEQEIQTSSLEVDLADLAKKLKV